MNASCSLAECLSQRSCLARRYKHTCCVLESKTVNAALAGVGRAGCPEVGRCISADALVAEQSKLYVVPFTLRQSEPRSVTFTGSTAHCGEASHKVRLSGILHQLTIIHLINECKDNLLLFSAVQAFEIPEGYLPKSPVNSWLEFCFCFVFFTFDLLSVSCLYINYRHIPKNEELSIHPPISDTHLPLPH